MDQELEKLIVRFIGESSKFVAEANKVTEQAKKTSKDMESIKNEVEGFSKAVSGFAKSAASSIASIGAVSYLKEAFSAFEGKESVMLKLNAAMEANGRDVEVTSQMYDKFATSMSRITTQSKTNILSLLQEAETFGMTGQKAERAVKNYIAAQASGHSMPLRSFAMLEEGHVERLQHILPGLKDIKDPAEKAAKAQEILGKMFKVAGAEADTAAGIIKMLHNEYKDLLSDFGKLIADGVKPVVKWLREAVQWFKGLSDNTKGTIVYVLALSAGFVSLVSVIGIASTVIGVIGSATGPILLAIVAIGAAIYVWVQSVGGVENAWNKLRYVAGVTIDWIMRNWKLLFALIIGPSAPILYVIAESWGDIKDSAVSAWESIKSTISDFMDWVEPIWYFFIDLMRMVWDKSVEFVKWAWSGIKWVLLQLWGLIKWVLDNTVGQFSIAWTEIRDTVVNALIYMQFMLVRWKDFADLIWTGTKLVFMEMINGIIYGFLAIPAAMDGLWSYTKDLFLFLMGKIVEFMGMIKDSIEGKNVDWSHLFKDFNVQFKADFSRVRVPDAMKNIEDDLRKEYNEKKDALGIEWEQFKAQKMKEYQDRPQEDKKKAEADGIELGVAAGGGIKKGIKSTKLDAVLFNSAEALSRFNAYRDNLNSGEKKTAGSSGGLVHLTRGMELDYLKAQLEALQAIKDKLSDQAKAERSARSAIVLVRAGLAAAGAEGGM